jgi:hypothetical protein
MGAVLSIYLLGLALCLLAGIALAGVLDPRGRWVGVATLPLGLCALVTLLYPLGAAMPGSAAAPAAVGVVVAGLALAAGLRLRAVQRGGRWASLATALRPTWAEVAVLAGGAIAGLLILIPTIDQGFATTIAVSNNDGWGYAVLVDWLTEHPFPRDVAPDLAEPLTFVPWTTDRLDFGFGFEHFAAALAVFLGRDGFEVVNAAAAVALAGAVGGWALLAGTLRPRLGRAQLALVTVAVASPALAVPFIENYTTQFVSICLWPVAIATFAGFAVEPGWRRLILAAVANAALIGVYPAMAAWLVIPVVAIALLAPEGPAWAGERLRGLAGPGTWRRVGRGAALLGALVVGVLVAGPIQVVRGVENLLFLDSAPVNAAAGFLPDDGYAAIFFGSAPIFPIIRGEGVGWAAIAGLLIVAAAAVAAIIPARRLISPRATLLAMALGILVTTGAIFVRYRVLDDLPYQVYKALISGGAVLAGLAVIGLIPLARSRLRAVGVVALGCVAAIWIPVTSDNLQASVDPGTGFREADVEMGRAVAELPEGSTVLVEGAAPDARSFQFRMMASYFGGRAPGVTMVGLGSTASYLTGGGAPEWRPARPWTHVLTARPEPVATGRTEVWTNGAYALAAAPALDVTPYGLGWYPPERDASGVFGWTAGPVDLVVSNRGAVPVRARLQMTVASAGRARVAVLTAEGRTARRRVPADALTAVGVELALPPRSATPVTLDARPRAATVAGDPRPLMLRVQGLRVVAA